MYIISKENIKKNKNEMSIIFIKYIFFEKNIISFILLLLLSI
jgi:hypothetical protein